MRLDPEDRVLSELFPDEDGEKEQTEAPASSPTEHSSK
jgi:hypothetical protein